jgi:Flp pilus assembly protein TadD
MLREAEAADRALLAGIRGAALERPDDLGVSFDLALVLHRLGEVEEAEPLYRRVLQANPKDGEARVNLARILGAANGPAAALEFLGLHPEPAAAVLCATGRLLRRDAPDSPAGAAALRDCLDHGGRLTPEEREALR